jgi:FkbM family methyltransferase
MHVLDVGANIGFYTMLAAAAVGPTGSVTAFEPGPASIELLAASVATNGFCNVTLFPCAVAATDGPCGLVLDDSNGKIVARGVAGATPVQAVSLDRLLGPGHPVDLLKIDIEGAEGLALAGMEGLLAARRPLIITEFSPAALRAVSGIEPAAYLATLRRLGYALRVIDRRDGLAPGPEDDATIMAHFTHTPSEHLDLLGVRCEA